MIVALLSVPLSKLSQHKGLHLDHSMLPAELKKLAKMLIGGFKMSEHELTETGILPREDSGSYVALLFLKPLSAVKAWRGFTGISERKKQHSEIIQAMGLCSDDSGFAAKIDDLPVACISLFVSGECGQGDIQTHQ